jgi:hypothetical protein
MTRIGASWLNKREFEEHPEDNYFYYPLAIDEELLPLTIENDKRLVLKENKNKGDNEKAPDMILEIYKPDPNKAKKEG